MHMTEHHDMTITGGQPDGDTQELVLEKTRVERPPLYKVLLLNDDFTPMDFVVEILQRFFRKGTDESVRIMLEVHHRGSGVCGVFTREIAETKVEQVTAYARQHNHPLKCIFERE